MRGSRFALLGLLTLLLLAAAVTVTPSLLNWDRYRDNIASLASTVLGRPVRIDGEVSLHLLPQAEFSAGRISIADGGDGIAIQARQLRMRVSLTGLMTGHLDPLDLVLQQPRISLPWPFNPAALTHRPKWLSGLSARIEDATIAVGNLQFSNVNGSFDPEIPPDSAAASLGAGAPELAARATGRFMNQGWRVMARLGEPPAAGSVRSVPMQIVLDGEGPLADTGVTLNGQIAADGAISGTVAGRGRDLSQLVPAPAVTWRADGRISIADGQAAANDLALQLAGATGRGAVALRLSPTPRLDLALAASRIDLDAWIDALRPRARAPTAGATGSAWSDVVTGIDLSADAATFRTGALRQVRIAVDLRPQQAVLREASATLPGDANLTAAGRITLEPATPGEPATLGNPATLSNPATVGNPATQTNPVLGNSVLASVPRFDGQIRARAPDLRATVAWLDQLGLLPLAPLPSGVLRQAAWSSGLHVARGQLSLDGLDGTLDGSHVTGTLALQLAAHPSGGRAAIAAHLGVDQLSLDPWLRGVPLDAALFRALPQRLASTGTDADLRLDITRATWAGAASPRATGAQPAWEDPGTPMTLDHLVVDGAWNAGGLTLRSLQAGAAGLQAALSGRFSTDGTIEQGQLLLVGEDATPLRRLLPPPWQFDELLWRAPLDLKVTGDGPAKALQTQFHMTLGDATIDAGPLLDLPAQTATGSLTLRHPGAPRLLRLLGLPSAQPWLGNGSFSMVTQLFASTASLTLDPLEAIAADLHARGRLTLNLGPIPSLGGQLAFDTLSLPLPAWTQPLPLNWAKGWQANLAISAASLQSPAGALLDRVTTQATLKDGVVRLDNVAALLAGGQLTGTVQFDTQTAPPVLDLDAALHGAALAGPLLDTPLDLRQGTVDGSLSLKAIGYSPSGLLATLAGQVHADIEHGTLAGFDADGAATALEQATPAEVADTARKALAGGATEFQSLRLDLKAAPGLAEATGALQSSHASTSLTGTVDLGGRRLDLTAKVQPSPPAAPNLTVNLTGGWQNPARTTDLSSLASWLAGR